MDTKTWITVVSLILSSTVVTTILNRIFAKKDRKQDKLDEILEKLEKHIANDDTERADEWRSKIIQFSDELRRGADHSHSEEMFNEILRIVTKYTDYCRLHENTYINSKAEAAIRNITETYNKILRGELQFL